MFIHFIFCLTLVFSIRAAVLIDFQVAQPPIVPQDVKQCTIKVLQRDFAFSFGSPEIVQLVPPTDCGPLGSWTAITLNFTVTSNGTQFDRLGIFTYRNVEIWRTSTPEPTRGDGIIWTYIKDVTQYMPLFTEPGTFILQLDNLIQQGLDGIYSTVLHATFYASSDVHPPAAKADLVIPLSTLSNTTGNEASVPPSFSVNVTVPQNTIELYAELFASGNGQEESWYFNVANEFSTHLPSDITFGQGPFREVRVLIDGQLAGVAFPYAVIFTGGFVPSFWRPIAAYGALDLPTYFLDLTPFIPMLTDKKAHTFTIDVISAEGNHTILQNWYISGLLQVVTDKSSTKRTTGKITFYNAPEFPETVTKGNVVTEGEINVEVRASHQLHVEAEIVRGSGGVTHVIWSQDLHYSNQQTYKNNASIQTLRQTASGRVISTHNGVPTVADTFSYPLNIDFTYLGPDRQNWTTQIDHTYNRAVTPNPFMISSTIAERQVVDGFFQLHTGGNFGHGASNNTFSYEDAAGNTYRRRVNADMNVITFDEESGSLATRAPQQESNAKLEDSSSVFGAVRLPGGVKT